MQENDEWLDAETAARHLALPTKLIYRLIDDGKLAAFRFPVRIRTSDLAECLERCRIKPGDLHHLNSNARNRRARKEPESAAKGAGQPSDGSR